MRECSWLCALLLSAVYKDVIDFLGSLRFPLSGSILPTG